MNRGKLVIVAMVLVGLALSSFAWWNRWSRSQRVIAHWGPEASATIRMGENVELLRLDDVDTTARGEIIDGTDPPRKVAQVVDISKAPGLIHARHQLLQDGAFDWEAPRSADCAPQWTAALRFTRMTDTATLLLDFPCQRARLLERNEEVGMKPIAAALEAFLRDVQPDHANPISTPANSQ